MTCTYVLSTDIGKVRLAIGDTDCTEAHLSDEEIQVLLDLSDSWQEAAVRACDTLIAKYAASATDVRMGPRAESRAQKIRHWALLKEQLADTYGVILLKPLGAEALTFSWTEEDEDDDDTEYT